MQANRYPQMLEMIVEGYLHPQKLIGQTISLEKAAEALVHMDGSNETGVTIINEFS